MDEKTIVKLKEDYVFFQDGDYVCIYQKSTKLVVLKLKAGDNAYNKGIKNDLNRPHNIKWLSRQHYWKWLGLVISKYSHFFDILDEETTQKHIMMANYFSVVNRERFAANYSVEHDFGAMRIFFWGMSAMNLQLYDSLKKQNAEIFFICDPNDEIGADSFMLSAAVDYLDQLRKDQIIDANLLEDMQIGSDDLFLVDTTGVDTKKLLELNDLLVAKHCVVLFYGNKPQEVVIGPLVIGGESACLHCMEHSNVIARYYNGENGFLDEVHSQLLAFFILRTVYYIKGNNLYYLLSDVQIPINKVFVISKDDITAKMEYVYRDTKCSCS